MKYNRRIVCAACKWGNKLFLSARHFDRLMHQQVEDMGCSSLKVNLEGRPIKQGFIDQEGKFLDRKEAFKVAEAAGQILEKTHGKDSKELYSEDIY